MNIVQTYSHLNGLEFLLVHKKNLWDEVVEVVSKIDINSCRTKVSKERRTHGKTLISPKELNRKFSEEFDLYGWHQQITRYWVTDDHRLIRKTIGMDSSSQRSNIISAGKDPILS